jgi:hypothetical protein
MAEIKRKSFNLIHKDVELKQSVKVERDWYTLLNTLVICMVIILSAISYLFKLNLKSGIEKKSENLATNINTNLNSVSKGLVKGRIDVLADKFSIYEDFLVQNFDANAFNEEIMRLYPGIKIDKFSAKPDSEFVQTNLRIETDGYNQLPTIINKLKSSQIYKVSNIRNVSFELSGVDATSAKDPSLVNQISKSNKFITLITVDFKKNQNTEENEN